MSYRISLGSAPALFAPRPLHARLALMRAAAGVALRTVFTRRGLAELDERALADIGLTPAEAETEARRAPWQLDPPRRRRPVPARRHAVGHWLREMRRRRRSRQAITGLDERMLKDIGVSFAEAEFEANKVFWQQ
jgi:uncharacterized protein YjiS (DUF1127 family)